MTMDDPSKCGVAAVQCNAQMCATDLLEVLFYSTCTPSSSNCITRVPDYVKALLVCVSVSSAVPCPQRLATLGRPAGVAVICKKDISCSTEKFIPSARPTLQ